MILDIDRFSSKYEVRKVTEKDIPEIFLLCKDNETYYKYYKPEPTMENVKEALTALPPGREMSDKYFVSFYDKCELIAILDLIVNYPDKHDAYIGWFMMNKKLQGAGMGTAIISEVVAYLVDIKFKDIKLAYIKANPEAKGFWEKNKFTRTGGDINCDEYILVNMKRNL